MILLLFLFLQAEWLCLNCQTQRALAGQLEDMAKMPISTKAEPMVTPKTELVKPPVPASKPSPEKLVDEVQTASSDVKAIVTTSAIPAASVSFITNAASTVTPDSVAPVSVDDKVKVDRALKGMLGTAAVDERELTAPVPDVESPRSVITAAEVLKETDKNVEASDKTQPKKESVLMQPAVADVVKVDHHIQIIKILNVLFELNRSFCCNKLFLFISGGRGYRHSSRYH